MQAGLWGRAGRCGMQAGLWGGDAGRDAGKDAGRDGDSEAGVPGTSTLRWGVMGSAGPARAVAIGAVARRRGQTLTYNRDRGSIAAAAALGAAGRPRDL